MNPEELREIGSSLLQYADTGNIGAGMYLIEFPAEQIAQEE